MGVGLSYEVLAGKMYINIRGRQIRFRGCIGRQDWRSGRIYAGEEV